MKNTYFKDIRCGMYDDRLLYNKSGVFVEKK